MPGEKRSVPHGCRKRACRAGPDVVVHAPESLLDHLPRGEVRIVRHLAQTDHVNPAHRARAWRGSQATTQEVPARPRAAEQAAPEQKCRQQARPRIGLPGLFDPRRTEGGRCREGFRWRDRLNDTLAVLLHRGIHRRRLRRHFSGRRLRRSLRGWLLGRGTENVRRAGKRSPANCSRGSAAAELRHHHPLHDAFAGRDLGGGIDPVSQYDLCLPVVDGHEHQQAIVPFCRPKLPAVEKIGGEPSKRLAIRRGDDHDHQVGPRCRANARSQSLELRDILCCERVRGVDHPGLRSWPIGHRTENRRRKARSDDERPDHQRGTRTPA